VELALAASRALGVLAAAVAVALAVAQQGLGAASVGLAVAAGVAAAVRGALVKLRQQFYYQPYDHHSK
jgi:hypothetical protein